MPVANFRTKMSGITTNAEKDVLIAQSMAYLSYADTTDTVGFRGKVTDVVIGDTNSGEIWVDWRCPIVSSEGLSNINAEMDRLSRVNDHACKNNPFEN